MSEYLISSTMFKALIRQHFRELVFLLILGLFGTANLTYAVFLISASFRESSNSNLILYAVLILVGTLVLVIAQIRMKNVGSVIGDDLRRRLASHLIVEPYQEFEQRNKGDTIQMATSDMEDIAMGFSQVPNVINNAILIIFLAILLLILNVYVGVFFAFVLAIGIAIGQFLLSRMRKAFAKQRMESLEIAESMSELINDNHAFRLSDNLRAKNLSILESALDNYLKIGDEGDVYWSWSIHFPTLIIMAAIGVVLGLNQPDLVPAESLFIFIVIILFIRQPISILMQSIPFVARANLLLEHISGSLDWNLNAFDADRDSCPEEISLFNITFRYPGGKQLLAVNRFVLAPGSLVLIRGHNGSGKTTLAKILCGLYTSESGSIKRGSGDLNEAQRRQLFFLSSDYVSRRYIHAENPESSNARDAIKALGLEDLVNFEGMVGRFHDLSLGEKKRVMLLEALLTSKPVLILDEPTNGLDPEYKQVFSDWVLPKLRSQGKTLLCISHDIEAPELFDVNYRLANGNLAATEPIELKGGAS